MPEFPKTPEFPKVMITEAYTMAGMMKSYIVSVEFPAIVVPAITTTCGAGEKRTFPGYTIPSEQWDWIFPYGEYAQATSLYDFLRNHPSTTRHPETGTGNPFPRGGVAYLTATKAVAIHKVGNE